jgi:hypothetical protein
MDFKVVEMNGGSRIETLMTPEPAPYVLAPLGAELLAGSIASTPTTSLRLLEAAESTERAMCDDLERMLNEAVSIRDLLLRGVL